VFLIVISLVLSLTSASAIQIGPRITCCSAHGPDIGGYKPFERPIPDKPLDGAKRAAEDTKNAIAKAGTDAWHFAVVEPVKFLSDPLAGIRRKANDMYDKAVADAKALAYQIVKWLSIGFGTALAFSIGLALGLTALFFRPKRHRRAHA